METLFITFLGISLSMGVLILIVSLFSNYVNKRFSARFKCSIWLLITLRLLVPLNPQFTQTLIQWPFFVDNSNQEIQMESYSVHDQLQPMDENTEAILDNLESIQSDQEVSLPTMTFPSSSINALTLFTTLWLMGTLIAFLIKFAQYHRFQKILKATASSVDDALDQHWYHYCQEAGLSSIPTIYQVSEIHSPMITGILHPCLYLPKRKWNEEELAVIFAHELTHIKNHDLWIKLAAWTASCIHWFNPCVYLLQRYLDLDLELACDEIVVQNYSLDQRKQYNEILFSLIQTRKHNSLLATAFSQKEQLSQRFAHVLDMRSKRKGTFSLSLFAVMMIGFGSLFGCQKEANTVLIPTSEVIDTFNDDRRETVSLNEWRTRQAQHSTSYEMSIYRIDEQLTMPNDNPTLYEALMKLELTDEKQANAPRPLYPFTIRIATDTYKLDITFQTDGTIHINDHSYGYKNTDLLHELYKGTQGNFLTAEHFTMHEVLPLTAQDIKQIEIHRSSEHEQALITLNNQASIQSFVQRTDSTWFNELTAETPIDGNEPILEETIITLHDGTQKTLLLRQNSVTIQDETTSHTYQRANTLFEQAQAKIGVVPMSEEGNAYTTGTLAINDQLLSGQWLTYETGSDTAVREQLVLEPQIMENTEAFTLHISSDAAVQLTLMKAGAASQTLSLSEITMDKHDQMVNGNKVNHYETQLPKEAGSYQIKAVYTWENHDTITMMYSYEIKE